MAVSNYSGFKLVEYALTGTTNWVACGMPMADSGGYKPEPQEQETSKGTTLYAGTKKEIAFNFPDMSKFDPLDVIMKADQEVDLRLTSIDGIVDTSLTGLSVKVKKNLPMKAGQKNTFEAKFSGFAI